MNSRIFSFSSQGYHSVSIIDQDESLQLHSAIQNSIQDDPVQTQQRITILLKELKNSD